MLYAENPCQKTSINRRTSFAVEIESDSGVTANMNSTSLCTLPLGFSSEPPFYRWSRRGQEFFSVDIYVTLIRHASLIVEETTAKNEFPKIYGRRKLLEQTCEEIKHYTTPSKHERIFIFIFYFLHTIILQ